MGLNYRRDVASAAVPKNGGFQVNKQAYVLQTRAKPGAALQTPS